MNTYLMNLLTVLAVAMVMWYVGEMANKKYYEVRNQRRRYQKALKRLGHLKIKMDKIGTRRDKDTQELLDIKKEIKRITEEYL